ncbi:MAG: N-acetylmuramoyl-L-alanine amidase [Verrucomicrobiota bacterium]|jgi:N-acetylmuramoyl-L-alanine amidase
MAQLIKFIFILAGLGLLASCATAPRAGKDTSHTFTTVVVDAGHGGKDTGAYRRYGGAEKTATLDVARRLERKLRESQFNVVMTRSSDVFISLDERVEIENRQKNSIFVAIHFNDSRRRGIKGFETYYYSAYARGLAERIQSKLLKIPGAVNRGVKVANFRVIRYANYPAVLVECGFLSNRSEGNEARSAEYRELLADKIAEAIVELRYGSGVYHSAAAATPAPEKPPQKASREKPPVIVP